jgi:hypothetical protein
VVIHPGLVSFLAWVDAFRPAQIWHFSLLASPRLFYGHDISCIASSIYRGMRLATRLASHLSRTAFAAIRDFCQSVIPIRGQSDLVGPTLEVS